MTSPSPQSLLGAGWVNITYSSFSEPRIFQAHSPGSSSNDLADPVLPRVGACRTLACQGELYSQGWGECSDKALMGEPDFDLLLKFWH